jgi:hypothetical protein
MGYSLKSMEVMSYKSTQVMLIVLYESQEIIVHNPKKMRSIDPRFENNFIIVSGAVRGAPLGKPPDPVEP